MINMQIKTATEIMYLLSVKTDATQIEKRSLL